MLLSIEGSVFLSDRSLECVINNPPNSPDLNPIENIWAHINHRISKEYGHITSVRAMTNMVISIWNEFKDHRWDHLIESMLDKIQAVIKAKGGSTKFQY